jgi:hypothetical protein
MVEHEKKKLTSNKHHEKLYHENGIKKCKTQICQILNQN